MRIRICVLAVVAVAGCSKPAPPVSEPAGPPLSVEEAKALIPRAAGEKKEVLEKLAPPRDLDLRDFDNLPLTILVLNLHKAEDFRFIGDELSPPSKLAGAISQSRDQGYFSIIQPKFISNCTCLTNGDSATGTVSFKADGIYEGKTEFTARRVGGKWRIEEFFLPTDKIGVRLGANGKWSMQQ
jgi:hypothetical protein